MTSAVGHYRGAVYLSGDGPFDLWPGPIVYRFGTNSFTAVRLPDARLLKVGGPIFVIWNEPSSSGFTLQTATSAFIATFNVANTLCTVYLLDNTTEAGTWKVTPVKTEGTASTGLIDQKDLYVAYSHPGTAVNSEWDVSARSWSGVNRPNRSREAVAGFVYGGSLYAVGDDAAAFAINLERYDPPSTDTWTNLTDANTEHFQADAGSVGNVGIVFGGGTRVCEDYSPVLDSWSSNIADLPHERSKFSASVINDRIYLICGLPLTQPCTKYFPTDDTYENLTFYSGTARANVASAKYNRSGVLAGGGYDDDATYHDDVELYDPTSDSWTVQTALPAERYAGSMIGSSGYGFYCGGFDNGDAATNTSHEFNAGGSWASIGVMPASQAETMGTGVAL